MEDNKPIKSYKNFQCQSQRVISKVLYGICTITTSVLFTRWRRIQLVVFKGRGVEDRYITRYLLIIVSCRRDLIGSCSPGGQKHVLFHGCWGVAYKIRDGWNTWLCQEGWELTNYSNDQLPIYNRLDIPHCCRKTVYHSNIQDSKR